MKRRRQESGFALLLVFLMAAVIAISLYMEIPRIAFEAQRQKEQLLIERGEQYKRAIQVFYTTNKRYPARIEELENLNNRRFLRRRYIDPMTGKDEWRLVHIQNGVLTDSVDTKKKDDKDKEKSGNSGQYVAELGGIGQTPVSTGQGGANLAKRRRDSDTGTGGTPSSGTNLPGMPGADAQNPNSPGTPGTSGPGGTPGNPNMPGQGGMPGIPGVPGSNMPGQTGSSGSSGNSGSIGSGAYIGGGYGIGSQPATAAGGTTPPVPGSPGAPGGFQAGSGIANQSPTPGLGLQQPGMNPQAQNAAAAMIQQILTQPRPGGMPTPAQGAQIGGGIAGFASKDDDDSIMVYNDHTNYGDWEFIFDFTKYRPPPNPLQGGQGTPASQLGSTPGSPLGTPASQLGSTPGSGFGQSPGAPPNPTIPH